MNAVKDKLFDLVDEELEAANAIYQPFHSTHEGYAVLREEVEEAQEAMKMVDFRLGQTWGFIKINFNPAMIRCTAKTLENEAVHLAAEAIQVAAMARKFQAIGKDLSAPGMEVE